MWLRWVVSNLLSEVADKKVRTAFDHARNALQQTSRADVDNEPPPGPPPHCDIVVVFAMAMESAALLERMKSVVTTNCASFIEHVGTLEGRGVAVIESDVGQKAARKATEDIVELHKPKWIISAGFAGSLSKSVHRGHIVMANEIISAECPPLTVPFQIDRDVVQATPALHVGRLLTVDGLIRDVREKRRLGTDFQALACDMETMAVARVCSRNQIRFLSVRVISDALDDALPSEIEHLIDQSSLAGKLGAVTRAVYNRPGSLKDMWKLRETALRASERLAKYLIGTVAQLEP